MGSVRVIQPTFGGGEYAPNVQNRVDLQAYAKGLKLAKNFIIHPSGGASNRPGLRYVASTKTPAKKSIHIPFKFSTDQAYALEFGEGYIRFGYQRGQVLKAAATAWVSSHAYILGDFVTHSSSTYYCLEGHTSGTFATDLTAGKWVAQGIYEVPTDYTESDLPDIKFVQSADVMYLDHPDFPPRALTRYAHDDWALEVYDYKNGPFLPANPDEAKHITVTPPAWSTGTVYAVGDCITEHICAIAHTAGEFSTDQAAGKWLTLRIMTGRHVALTLDFGIFDAKHVGSLWKIIHDVAAQSAHDTFTSGNSVGTGIQSGSTWRLITHGSWSGTLRVSKSTDGGLTWEALRSFSSSSDSNVDTYGDTGEQQCLIRMDNPSQTLMRPMGGIGGAPGSWSGTATCDLSSDAFSCLGILRVTQVTDSQHAKGDIISPISDTTATSDWAEGAWSEYRGYPTAVGFYQDRLAHAAPPSQPQVIELSRTGAYDDFGRSSILQDDDAISINLPSRNVNAICNLVTLDELLALTISSEWSVGSGGSGAMTPSTVGTHCQGYRGCSTVGPILVGNRVVYVQPMGNIVRDFAYVLSGNGYDGDDLTLLANHLFTGYKIVAMAYQQSPDSIIWMVRDDGILLSMTYLKEQEVVACSWHETDGLVESVCCIPGDGYDEVWLIVKRGNQRFIEVMERRMMSTDPEDQFFVDCGLSYDGEPVTTISGLSHLEGQAVSVLADGCWVQGKTVTSGEITLDSAASIVHVGLPYVSDLKTLRLEIPQQDGTLQGKRVNVTEVRLRLLNTMGGKVGPDENGLREINVRTDEPLDSPTDLYTGEVRLSTPGGFRDGGETLIRQEAPLPITVLAVIPTVVVGR